jgi:hypothetical protein
MPLGAQRKMAQQTVKIVADVKPEIAAALTKAAAKAGITKRAAIEEAISCYIDRGEKTK